MSSLYNVSFLIFHVSLDMMDFSSLTQQTQPAGRRQAGSLQGRQRLGGSYWQEQEVHGWRSAQPGRSGEEALCFL